jgi:phage terminase large subunit-like protein
MLANVAVQQDPAGNNKPDKEKSGEKIDGIVAGIMGLARKHRRGQDTRNLDSRSSNASMGRNVQERGAQA